MSEGTVRPADEIKTSALSALGYLHDCERGDAQAVTAYLGAIHTTEDLWSLVSALSGHYVGLLRMASSLTGQEPGKLLGALAQDIRENR